MTEPEQPVVAVPLRAALEHIWRARMAISHALQNGPNKGELLDLLVEALAEIDKANEAAALAVEAVRPETDIDEDLREAKATIEAMSGDAADLTDLIHEAALLRTALAHVIVRTHDSGCGTCDAARALLTAEHELPSSYRDERP